MAGETLPAREGNLARYGGYMTEAKVKSNSVMTVKQMDGKLVFAFLGAGEFAFDPDKASAENRARAMMYGFKQRIADGAALSRDTETGKAATPEEKMAEARKIADHYMTGSTDWALKVAERQEGDGTWLAKALVALGKAAGVNTVALVTAMDAPLGRSAGNACEVAESVEVLAGGVLADEVEGLRVHRRLVAL